MILYSIFTLLVGATGFKLGAHVTIISLISTGSKVIAVFLLVAAIVLLYRKLRRTPKQLRPT
jgi:hypothetical protein